MIISELLPNPVGKDTEGEFIELVNNTDDANSLFGWTIQDASGKSYTFDNEIVSPHGFFVLPYSTSKISLNNNGDTITLINSKGVEADSIFYKGSMKDGEAIVRNKQGEVIKTQQPTPGSENIIVAPSPKPGDPLDEIAPSSSEPATMHYIQEGQIIRQANMGEMLMVGLGVAVILTALFWFLFKKIASSSEKDV